MALEQPETESESVDESTETQLPESTSIDEPVSDEAVTPETDAEEYEIEGKKYQVDKALAAHLKELRDGNLRQADYTQKTQTVAQEKAQLEAQQREYAARQQFQAQHLEKLADVRAMDRQLEAFSKIDWNALTDADPVQALKLDRQMRDLQTQRQQTVGQIEQATARAQWEQQQATARGLQEAKAQLAKEIKGFGTPELTKALVEVGKQNGYKPEELTNINDPRAVRLLHKAYLYDQLVKAKTTPEKESVVTPITRVSGASATTAKDPSRMSDAEFASWRKRQISQRR